MQTPARAEAIELCAIDSGQRPWTARWSATS